LGEGSSRRAEGHSEAQLPIYPLSIWSWEKAAGPDN
jgi:hypothetical protein